MIQLPRRKDPRSSSRIGAGVVDPMPDARITGREPRLSPSSRSGRRRLSVRGLATMLNLLPPEAISLEAAAAALRSKDFFVRYNAARLLGRRGDRDARLILHDTLSNAGAPTRASAARVLHHFSWFTAEPIVHQALRDPDSRVREAAVYALCDMHDLNAYHLLAYALRDEEDNVCAAAAWGLRACRDPAAVPVLEVVVTHAVDPDVRVRALEALGANGAPAARPVARRLVDDPDPDVKYAATLSWIELAGEACLAELADVIRGESGAAREPILRAFFHATNYLAIDVVRSPEFELLLDALAVAVEDPLPAARMAAAWPLAWLPHERAPTLLRQAYERERDAEVKAHFVRVAVGLMSPAGGLILRDALGSPDEIVRQAAELIRAAATVLRIESAIPPGEGPIWLR